MPNILTFDITSRKSIISNINYDFEMPKGGLSSMIAIGDKEDYEFFKDKKILTDKNISIIKSWLPDIERIEITGGESFINSSIKS